MGDRFNSSDSVTQHGIYQSDCVCCTAITVHPPDRLPRCLQCGEAVAWRLVQAVDSTRPPSQPRRPPSGTMLRQTDPPRPRFDSAAGES